MLNKNDYFLHNKWTNSGEEINKMNKTLVLQDHLIFNLHDFRIGNIKEDWQNQILSLLKRVKRTWPTNFFYWCHNKTFSWKNYAVHTKEVRRCGKFQCQQLYKRLKRDKKSQFSWHIFELWLALNHDLWTADSCLEK